MEERIVELKKNALFSAFTEQTIRERIIPVGRFCSVPKHTVIYSAHECVNEFGIILSGCINLIRFSKGGGGDLHAKLKAPKTLGLDLVCTKTRVSPYHAVAAEDTVYFSFPAEMILEPGALPETERLNALGDLLQMIANLNMQKDYRLAILTHSSLRERVIIYLTMQAAKRQAMEFEIPFDREEMADFLSVNRSALSHELGLMRKEGLIDFRRNRFRLLKLGEKEFESFAF